jgi:hypothetical protein
MTPRGLLTTIGATALGFGLVIGGAPAIPDVFAQEATPPAAEAPVQTEQQQKADFEAQRAQGYDSFVTALASELGSDKAAVDAAIRTALTQQVDERAAAGDLDVEQAAALKAVIEVSDAPLFLGFGGPGGMHGFEGHDGRHEDGDRDGSEGRGSQDEGNDQTGDDESSTSLPADDAASNQSASAPVTPAGTTAIN